MNEILTVCVVINLKKMGKCASAAKEEQWRIQEEGRMLSIFEGPSISIIFNTESR